MYKETDFDAIALMGAISLSEMSSVSLMNRTDTKFITTVAVLKDVLSDAVGCGYRVCEIDGQRLMGYASLYYDTPDLKMFTAHRNGKKTRQKVRVRTYLTGGDTFLEIKRKNNHGRTKKKRIVITEEDFGNFNGNEAAVEFLRGQVTYNNKELKPQLRTIFNRITLVNNNLTERLTIDFNLRFENKQTGKVSELPNVMIIELKQDGHQNSKMKNILIDLHITPFRISKYCIGTVLTNDNVKYNRFKTKIIYLNKISK
jgi:hypothetical protein